MQIFDYVWKLQLDSEDNEVEYLIDFHLELKLKNLSST